MKRLGFIPVILFTVLLTGCSAMINDLKSLEKNGSYVVVNHFEDIDTDDYNPDLETVSLPFKGIVGKKTQAEPEEFEGFELAEEIVQKTIADGNSTAVDVFYKRKRVSFTFDPNTGCWDNTDSSEPLQIGELKFGRDCATIEIPELSMLHYDFIKWSPEIPVTVPTEDMYFTAQWNQFEANYTVVSHFENIENDDYDLDLESISTSYIGIIGTETDVTAEDYEGFVLAEEIVQKTIENDDSTVVDVYYKRKRVSFTFYPNEGVWTDSNSIEPLVLDGFKYGMDCSAIEIPELYLSHYNFKKWEPEIPSVVLDEDLSFVAQWSQFEAPYTVEHYFEIPLSGNSVYELKTEYTETKIGVIGKYTNAVHKDEIEGFEHVDPIYQLLISDDGKTVVKAYYNRKIVQLDFYGNGGLWTDTNKKSISGKYEEQITPPSTADLTRQDYVFEGWEPEIPSVFPMNDNDYYAVWKQTQAEYTIKYFFENIEDSDYTEDLLKSKKQKGEIGKETTVSAVKYDGFNDPVIEQCVVSESGDSVVNVKYSRKLISITLDPNGGEWADGSTESKVFTKKYGSKVGELIENPEKADFEFLRWGDAGLPETFPSFGVAYDAKWSQSAATYTVHHLFENANNSEYVEDLARIQTKKGEIDKNTVATPYTANISGFISQPITQEKIKEDGSTSVNVYYKRKTVTLSFDGNGGSWSEVQKKTGKYGSTLTPPSTDNLIKEDYKFEGWNKTVPGTYPLENETYVAVWSKEFDSYTVKYYFQNKSATGYDLNATLTETRKGSIGTTTAVAADRYQGFNDPVVTQTTITEGGSAVVEVRYDRKEYTLTYKLNYGSINNSTADVTTKGYYETAVIPISAPIRARYRFTGWNVEVPSTYTSDLTLTACWEKSEATYVVHHKYENVNNDFYIEDESQRETLWGAIGQNTKAVAKTVTGFEVQSFSQQIIAENNTTEVSINYRRKRVQLTFNANTGAWSDGTVKTVEGKFGGSVTIPSTATLKKEDYEFKGWSPSVPLIFPAFNAEYNAQWEQAFANYKVEYYREKIDTSDYELFYSVENKKGRISSTTTETADLRDGFEPAVIKQTIIAPDGSSVVKVEYARKIIELTLDPNGGKWSNNSTDNKVIKGKYGAATAGLYTVPVREDFAFVDWEPNLPSTFPVANKTYTAEWSQTVAEYTVHHLFENIPDEGYKEDEELLQHKDGEIGKDTKAAAYDITGFVPQSFVQTTVLEDGSASVSIYYKRVRVTFTFDGNGGSWTVPKTVTGKFGAVVTKPSTTDLIREDYQLNGWSPSVPSTFPETDLTFTAQWKQVKAPYSVKYLFQNLINDEYSIDSSKTITDLKGTIGSTTNVTADTVEGYTAPEITQVKILQDGSAVVEVRYARQIYKHIYKLAGGSIGGSSADVEKSGKFGAAVVEPVAPVRTNYIFAGWDKDIPEKFTSDITFTAKWTAEANMEDLTFSGTGDIAITEKDGTYTVAVPHAGNWSFEWYVNKQFTGVRSSSYTPSLSAGNYELYVVAKETNEFGTYSYTSRKNIKINN